MKTSKSAKEIFATGLIEVAGANDGMPSGTYSDTMSLALAPPSQSGEIESVTMYTSHTGTGAVQILAGTLLFFDDNPQISGTMAALSWAARRMVIGQVDIAASDWMVDGNAASVSKHLEDFVPFQKLDTLYIVFRNQDADAFNSAANDNEMLYLRLWRRKCEGRG